MTVEKTERSRAAMRAGRMLMQWKTQEEALPGAAVEEYADAVRELQQGVSEAVLREQVPPGYHEAIRRYFDDLRIPEGGPGEASNETEAAGDKSDDE